jgi:hypothetical protein
MRMAGAPDADRERFTRTGGGSTVQAILSFGGGAAFFVFTVFLLGQPAPMFVFALLPAFFGVLLLVGGVAALGHADDDAVIEVGPDGVWLPGLGRRRWAEFREIRVELASGPAAQRVATYRRLGFVPVDPAPAERLPLAERLASTMVTGYYRFTAGLMGNRPIDFAPFGVQEVEIGHERFEHLLALVATHVSLGRVAERPAGEEEPATAQPPGYLPRALPAMLLPAARAAAAGFVVVLIAPTVEAWMGASRTPVFGIVVVAVVGLGFVVAAVVDARRARAKAGVALVPLLVVMLLGALAGALVAVLFGAGFSSGFGGR